jgi:hypothetical protein
MSQTPSTCIAASTLGLLAAVSLAGQTPRQVEAANTSSVSAPSRLEEADRSSIVEKLAEGIEEGYVLEEKGRDIARRLRELDDDGRFTAEDPTELAEVLTRTLQQISGDVHFRVSVGGIGNAAGGPRRRMVRAPGPTAETGGEADRRPVARRVGTPEAADMPQEMGALFQQMAERFPDNYRARILPGNVGLLEIDILFPPHDRLGAALQELADTDALILDIRTCPGGTGMTVRPLESVFFAEPTHLLTMAHRGAAPMHIQTTEQTPGGVRYVDKPVYILTSRNTGSACEELAWSLKYHDKATLVGETTGGAGHAITAELDLGHGLRSTLPSMRPIHPHFEGGFEGVGVPPDLTIASRRAAGEAHLLALTELMADASGEQRRQLEALHAATALAISRQERHYAERGRALRSYSALFEQGHQLHVKDGELYYTAEGRTRGPLVASEEQDRFELGGGVRSLSLKVERGDDGQILSLAVSPEGSDRWRRFERVSAL